MTDRDKEIANIILQQLGRNKFTVMTGAKNYIILKNGLSFKFGRNRSKANYLKIRLNTRGTYDLEFGRCHGYKYRIIKEINDVYAENLQSIFTDFTGLDTYMGSIFLKG